MEVWSHWMRSPRFPVLGGAVCLDGASPSTTLRAFKAILTRLAAYPEFRILVLGENIIFGEPIERWPQGDCVIAFHASRWGVGLGKIVATTKSVFLARAAVFALNRRPSLGVAGTP